jgi:prevent-host-death family protein
MPTEEFPVAEAKRRFSELAQRVSRGESFLIRNRGRPAVALVPPQRAAEPEPAPLGLAAFAGALAEWDTLGQEMRDVVAARQDATDRPAPPLS